MSGRIEDVHCTKTEVFHKGYFHFLCSGCSTDFIFDFEPVYARWLVSNIKHPEKENGWVVSLKKYILDKKRLASYLFEFLTLLCSFLPGRCL